MNDVFETICSIVKEECHDPEMKINLSTNLINDLGMDSLVLVGLVIKIEEIYNIQLPDDFFTTETFMSLASIVAVVKNQIATYK